MKLLSFLQLFIKFKKLGLQVKTKREFLDIFISYSVSFVLFYFAISSRYPGNFPVLKMLIGEKIKLFPGFSKYPMEIAGLTSIDMSSKRLFDLNANTFLKWSTSTSFLFNTMLKLGNVPQDNHMTWC